MTRIERIEREIRSLSAEELSEFRLWFYEFEAEVWDQRIANDAETGRLDGAANRAIRDHRAGRSKEL